MRVGSMPRMLGHCVGRFLIKFFCAFDIRHQKLFGLQSNCLPPTSTTSAVNPVQNPTRPPQAAAFHLRLASVKSPPLGLAESSVFSLLHRAERVAKDLFVWR